MAADAVEAANPQAVKPNAAAAPSLTNSLIQASPVIVSPLRTGNGEGRLQFLPERALQKLNYRLVGCVIDIRLQLAEISAWAVAARFIAKSALNRLARHR